MSFCRRSVVWILPVFLMIAVLSVASRGFAAVQCQAALGDGQCGGFCTGTDVCANVAGTCQCVDVTTFCSNLSVPSGTNVPPPMCGGFCASQFASCQLAGAVCLCVPF